MTKRGSSLGNIDIDESSDKSVAQQLRDILSKNGVRVVDLFREWDEDGNGSVSKKEFRKAMPLLGMDLPTKAIDELFDQYDPDKSGVMEMNELQRMLRKTTPAPEPPKGLAAALGKAKKATDAAGKLKGLIKK